MPYKDYEKQKKNALENYYKNKKKRLKQVKEYYYKNWKEKQIYRNNWLKNNPEKYKAYKDKYFKKYYSDNNNLLKKIARYALRNAIRRGEIVKPTTCSNCLEIKKSNKIQGHHHKGYEKQYHLDVIWLCDDCHKKHEYTNKNLEFSIRS